MCGPLRVDAERGSIIYRCWGKRACPILFKAKQLRRSARRGVDMLNSTHWRELRQDRESTVHYATDGIGLL